MTNLSDRLHNAGSTKAAQTAAFASTLLLASFVSPTTLHAQQDPQTNAPYDLRVYSRIIDENQQETRDLTPGKEYTLEILAQNPFGTNSETRSINLGFQKPEGLSILEAIQPTPYYDDEDFFEGLSMHTTYNATWTDGNLLQLNRKVNKTETKPAKNKGIIGKFRLGVISEDSPKASTLLNNLDVDALIGIPPNMIPQRVKSRSLMVAIIPTGLTNNGYMFYNTSDGQIPPCNGDFATPYVSAFGGPSLILESSSDLTKWSAIYTNASGSFEAVDLTSTNNPLKFYRVKSK